MTRAAAIVGLSFAAACAHLETASTPPVVDDGATALKTCVVKSEACPALARRLEAKLRDRRDAAAAHRLAWRMTELLGRGDVTGVGSAIGRCRAGHDPSCRALWWALDRLYLAQDATLARANECPLTDAVAAAFAPEAP